MTSLALASLVETYTDSESEETVSMESISPDSPVQTKQSELSKPRGLKTLACYLSEDDAFASEDELVSETTTSPATSSSSTQPSSSDALMNQMFMDLDFPPEPTGTCSSDLTEKIVELTKMMELNDCDMNQIIQQRKSFRNPSMYEKLIDYCNINEFGTNFEPHVYDPLKWDKTSYYDELAKTQDADMSRREKERRMKTKVKIVTGIAKNVTNGAAVTKKDTKKRKSKCNKPVNAGLCLGNNATALTSPSTSSKGILSASGPSSKKVKI